MKQTTLQTKNKKAIKQTAKKQQMQKNKHTNKKSMK